MHEPKPCHRHTIPTQIFPWSRGGLSVIDNFAAVHWYANGHIKRDKIPVSMIPVTEINGMSLCRF